jgi:hypothetical protein
VLEIATLPHTTLPLNLHAYETLFDCKAHK